MIHQHIGRKIRDHRRRKGLTQAELAERVGISLSFLGHIERGTRKLSVETLYELCKALNCSADQLLGTGKYTPTSDNPIEMLKDAIIMLENSKPQ